MSLSSTSFVVMDYVIFGSMLLISTCIGLFYAVKDRNRKNTENYFLAGRTMNPFPVAFSLCVSFLSAVTVLGTPAEVYKHGTMYIWVLFGCLVAFIVTATVYLPVYYKNGLSSVNQYLEMRFNQSVRILASFFYLVQTSLYTGLVILAPASALNAVTGFNIWAIAITTGLACTMYSCLGGLKAVLWNDTLQMLIMVAAFLSVIIKASVDVGGFHLLWKNAFDGGRIQFWNFDMDPRLRHTTWTVVIGSSFFNLALYSANQAQVQRYLSCRTLKSAKIAIAINYLGMVLLLGLAVLCGIAMYGYYHDCDPLSVGDKVTRSDQLMPYMVMEIFGQIPGMTGLFTAAVFSGSLSTISTSITAMSSVTVQDLLKPFVKISEEQLTMLSRILIFAYGTLCLFFAYLMSQLGGILQVAISILSLAGAPLLVAFTMGIVFTFANTQGVISGMIGATFGTVLLFCENLFNPVFDHFQQVLPLSVNGCLVTNQTDPSLTTAMLNWAETTPSTNNSTVHNLQLAPQRPIAGIFAISYMYMTAFGFLLGLSIGIFTSIFSGGWTSREKVQSDLIASIICMHKSSDSKNLLLKPKLEVTDETKIKFLEKTNNVSSYKSSL